MLWNERHEKPAPKVEYAAKDERISQVWFAGMHSNVGGGYPDNSLAHIPLCWIMDEAQACGLKFKTNPPAEPDAMALRKAARDKDGRLYNSRGGVGGSYRYGPRKKFSTSATCGFRRIRMTKSRSRFRRSTKARSNAYAKARMSTHRSGFPSNIQGRPIYGMVLPAAQNRYELPVLAKARAKAQERVWNLVWLRRVVYFATVFATLYLLLYPLFRIFPRVDEFSTSFRPVSDLIRLAGSFVPDAFEPWLNAYARGPGQFLITLATVVVLTLLGSKVGAKITDAMRGIWKSEAPVAHGGPLHELIYGLRTSRPYQWMLRALKRHIIPFAFAVLVVYLGLTFTSHLLFNIEDAAGWAARKSRSSSSAARHPNRTTVKD